MIKKLDNPLNKISVKKQLILFFLFIAISAYLLNHFANIMAENILKNHVTDAYVQLNKQHYQLLNRDIDSVNKMMTTIILNPATQQMAIDNHESVFQRVVNYQAISRFINSYSMGVAGSEPVYYSLYLYDPSHLYDFAPVKTNIGSRGVSFYSNSTKTRWMEQAIKHKGNGFLDIIGKGDHKTLSFIRAVNNMYKGNSVIGVLVATQMENKVQTSLESVSLPSNSQIYLTNWSNHVLASTSGGIGPSLKLPKGLTIGLNSFEGNKSVITPNFIYVMHYNFINQEKLIYKIPIHSLLIQQNELKHILQMILAGFIILGLIALVYFWRSFYMPLLRLARFAKNYEPEKNVPILPEEGRRDEVGILIESVYDMANRINTLIKDSYTMEIKQKEAELQILYEQINPHLLYNTLESIYWKSSLEGNTESAEMIKDLSKLMRIGLSRGRDLIPLEEEIQHAKAYVGLERKRYDYEFRIAWELDPDSLRCHIPKISLQPILENAIIHGVRQMGEDGDIRISSILDTKDLVIYIEDNGYKKVDYEAINNELENPESNLGYGLRNVHQRIRLHFGPKYGVTVRARKMGGTVVILRLPKTEEPK